MELRDFQASGEPGAIVYLADCVQLMKIMPPASVDMIFADPPYRLSNGGVTVKNGSRSPVDKGAWDRSMGVVLIEATNYRFQHNHLDLESRLPDAAEDDVSLVSEALLGLA